MKRILIIADSIKRKTGYATVARNILKHLIKTGKYKFAQLGLADMPAPIEFPEIDYYSQAKMHKDCCKKGICIEYKPAGPHEQVKYIKLNPKLNPDEMYLEDQNPCHKGDNVLQDNYAFDSVYFVIQHFRPDIVIPINDLWGFYNILHIRNRKTFKFIPYLAIDSDCLFPAIQSPIGRPDLPNIESIPSISAADTCVVFTDWAQEVINKTAKVVAGKELTNLVTIPHGVDTSVWKPLPDEQRLELRKKFFKRGNEIFLIGSVARNQPRKRLDAIFHTMKIFKEKYEKQRKIFCYFHCSLKDKMGWDLFWLAHWYGVQDRCIFDPNLLPGIGPTDEQLNEIVNCFDAHLSLTNSEGWHLPALETCAAGVPMVITNYSAHADWGKDALCFVKPGAYEHEPKTGFIKAIASVEDAAKQLSLLYNSPKLVEEYKNKGVKLGKKLDWENVCKKWEELLDNVDISDLKPDRWNDEELLPPTPEQVRNKKFELTNFGEKND